METVELLEIAGCGEETRQQFKADLTNALYLASVTIAFANSGGGQLFIGVANDGSIEVLDAIDIHRINY